MGKKMLFFGNAVLPKRNRMKSRTTTRGTHETPGAPEDAEGGAGKERTDNHQDTKDHGDTKNDRKRPLSFKNSYLLVPW